MRNQPNERMDSDGNGQRTDAEGAWLADGHRDGETGESRHTRSGRWVQLAYDLEQYGDPDPDERGEVF